MAVADGSAFVAQSGRRSTAVTLPAWLRVHHGDIGNQTDKKVTEGVFTMAQRPIDVVVLATPVSTASTIYGMYDIFRSAGRDWSMVTGGAPGPESIHTRVVAASSQPLELVNAVRIAVDVDFDHCGVPDLICIPDLNIPPGEAVGPAFAAEVAWLRRCYAQGSALATACSGALLLAAAGVLDGEEATTHWAYCDTLSRCYPQVKVRSQRSLVVSGEGGRLIMSGGGTSWLDLALFLIARYRSVEEAMQVARLNLIDWHSAGQQPYGYLAQSRQSDDALVSKCQVWIAEHYDTPAPVAAMVQLSGLPERSFKRRFAQATGMTPLEYVHTLRLEEAKQMLEATELQVEAIANEVGYEDASFFSRLFRRQVGLTPAQYRKRFGAMRRVLQEA